jgi:hypothetical protein
MIYRYIAPSAPLQEFIRDYLVAHFIFDKDQNIPFKPYPPKPEQTITFLAKGKLTINNPLTGDMRVVPGVSICGQQVSRYNFYLTTEYLMLRVHFYPGALFRLLGIPLAEFTDNWLDATSVTGREIHEVNDCLANCVNYAQMIAVLEDYLIKKIKKVKSDRHALDRVAFSLFTNPSGFSLDWLADQSCLSPRQFNRGLQSGWVWGQSYTAVLCVSTKPINTNRYIQRKIG